MDSTKGMLLSGSLYLSLVVLRLALFTLAIWLVKEILLGLTRSKKRLDGKIILLTGGDSGVGFEVAKDLARRGAFLVLAAKNIKKLQFARDKIARATGNEKVIAMKLDLGSFQSVIEFSGEFKAIFSKVDIIINNAGIGLHLGSSLSTKGKVPSRVMSPDGFELMMQVNYIGPFLLFDLLSDLFTEHSRIINVLHPLYMMSSMSHGMDLNMQDRRTYDPDLQFSNSKLALGLFGEEMSRIHGLGCVNVIPGLILRTNFYIQSRTFIVRLLRLVGLLLGKNSWQASQSIVTACLMTDRHLDDGYSGPIVLSNCRPSGFWTHSALRNEELSTNLCAKTIEALNQCS